MKKLNILSNHILIISSTILLFSNVQADDYADNLLKRIQDKGTITVGTEGTYAPFTYHDKSGKLTGYDVEVTRAVAKELGINIEFKETQWDAMLSGLNSRRFDLVANQVGLTSPERRAKYDLSAPYSYSGAVVVARKEDDRVTNWSSLKGLSSAQSLTSNYNEMAKKNGAKVVGVDGLAQALQLVLQKRVDITINDNLAILDFLKKKGDKHLKIVLKAKNKVPSGFVFNKGNKASIELFNRALEKVSKNGTLKLLGEKFFGTDISNK